MIMANSPLIGNGNERGISYGKQWATEFKTVEPHLQQNHFWQSGASLPLKNKIKERYMSNMSNTRKYFPDIADEIDGIAEAAGVSVNVVLDWILIDGFSWGLDGNDKNMPSAETMCTNMSITDCCDEPMLMQTVDAPDGALLVLHRVYPKDGYNHAHIGRLGSVVATSGFNEKGLAIGGVSCYAATQDIEGKRKVTKH